MRKNDLIKYWQKMSDNDFRTMGNLYNTKDYHWALLLGHLVIEKLLKAYFVKKISNYPPYTHNLLQIAVKAGLKLTKNQQDFLDTLTSFNITARYADYKLKFYKRCTKNYTETNIAQIRRLRLWLKELIKK